MSAKAGAGESLKERSARRFAGWLRLADLLIYPSFCEICGCFLEKPAERIICRECLNKLRPGPQAFCPVCGRFFEGAGESHLCGACLKKAPPFTRHRSYTKYEGVARDVVLLFKFGGNEVLGKPLASLIGGALGGEEDLWNGVDVVIPVPLHPKKLKKRGYNQAAVLARHLAKLKEIRFVDNRLVKYRNNSAQTALDAREREENVKGAYLVRRPDALSDRTVLLVDDVFTTGATIGECSRVLLRAGAGEVRAVTFAQA